MWWSAQTWTTLQDPFALHAPSHRIWLADFGLVEEDVLCAIMTIAAGVNWGSLCKVSLVFFPFDSLHIAAKKKRHDRGEVGGKARDFNKRSCQQVVLRTEKAH